MEDELMESPLGMHSKIFCAHCNDGNCQKTMDDIYQCMRLRLMIDKYFEDSDEEMYTTSNMSDDNHLYG